MYTEDDSLDDVHKCSSWFQAFPQRKKSEGMEEDFARDYNSFG